MWFNGILLLQRRHKIHYHIKNDEDRGKIVYIHFLELTTMYVN